MKWYQILLVFTLVNVTFQNYTYDVQYLSVPLDHFSYTNNVTFKLRYLINDSYWNCNGPIFFYTGNEGDINMFAQNTGFMWDIAEEFQALLVFAEHRYYGVSLPFGNLSFSAPHYVGYLTSTQALADFVYLIDFLQESEKCNDFNDKNPVIAFGGSYGGMLATWLRIKYPATVLGAVAASAPVWQFENLLPCDIFSRIVTSVYRTTASFYDCSKLIRKSWQIIRQITSTMEGKNWLTLNWKLCTPLKTDADVKRLLNWLRDVYSNMAIVNYPYATDFIISLPAYPVKTFCNKLRYSTSDPYNALLQLGKALAVYVNNTGTTECVNIYSESSKLGELGWDFQTCTELIMPMCSKENDMFISEAWNFTKFSEDCFDRWKIKVNTEKTPILEYGGKHIQTASNIVFSNGLLDPWSGGGVLKNISRTLVAYVMPDTAHHLDFRSFNQNDPPSAIKARNFHRSMIRQWLKTYYMDYLNIYYY